MAAEHYFLDHTLKAICRALNYDLLPDDIQLWSEDMISLTISIIEKHSDQPLDVYFSLRRFTFYIIYLHKIAPNIPVKGKFFNTFSRIRKYN